MNLREIHWSLHFQFWTAMIAGAGATLGAVLFSLAGGLFPTGRTAAQLAVMGRASAGSISCSGRRAWPWCWA